MALGRKTIDDCTVGSSCNQPDTTGSGKGLMVIGASNCPNMLEANPESSYPSIPVALRSPGASGSVELRDGSANSPIELPRLATVSGSAFSLVSKGADGRIVAYEPTETCGKFYLEFHNGQFMVKPLVMPDVLTKLACEVSSAAEIDDEIDFILAGKEIPDKCNKDKTVYLVKRIAFEDLVERFNFKYSVLIGNGVDTSFVLNHNLNIPLDKVMSVIAITALGAVLAPTSIALTVNSITIVFGAALAANTRLTLRYEK